MIRMLLLVTCLGGCASQPLIPEGLFTPMDRETVCFSCPAMPDELSVSDPLCNNPEGENVMAYPNSADPGQLNEDMIKLLMKQNDLLKQRLALEIEDNGRYRAIIEDQDRVPF